VVVSRNDKMHLLKIIYSDSEVLSYTYDIDEFSYSRQDLLLKGYRFYKNKNLKYHLWHDPCGYNIGHDRCKLPHVVLNTDEKAYQDRTKAQKIISKDQLSNKTVGLLVGSATAILCAGIAFIIREYDPNNIKNIQKNENIVHLSHGDQKAIDALTRIFNERMTDITTHTRAVQAMKYKCLEQLAKQECK
jgi:hypothetical protein